MKGRDHPYCYPGTDVLRNKEDIRDKDELEAFERGLSARRLETLRSDIPISVEASVGTEPLSKAITHKTSFRCWT